MNFFLAVLGLCCCSGRLPSRCGERGLLSSLAHRLLSAVASVAEHGLEGAQASAAAARRLWSTRSLVIVHRFSCSEAQDLP